MGNIYDPPDDGNASDLEIYRVTCDLVTLYRAPPQYYEAYAAARRAAIEAERDARHARTLTPLAYDIAAEAAEVTGADYDRCQAIIAEIAVAESRWTIRRELSRIADLARRGAKLPDPPARIADAADQLHHEIEAAQLRDQSRQFERATRKGKAG